MNKQALIAKIAEETGSSKAGAAMAPSPVCAATGS